MSDSLTKKPLIDLPLASVEGGRLHDASGQGRDGLATGNAVAIPDPTFGAVLRLDGASGVTVADPGGALQFGDQAYTVEVWARAQAAEQRNDQQTYTSIVEAWDGLNGGYGYALRLELDTGVLLACRYGRTPDATVLRSTVSVADGVFHHLALVRRDGRLQLYIDGRPDAGAVDLAGPDTRNGAPLTLGRNSAAQLARANPAVVDLAHLRVYGGALRQDEIQRDMNADLSSMSAWVASYPLDFSLRNSAGLSLIRVASDPTGLSLELLLYNTSGEDLLISAPDGVIADAEHHHFALAFRPGVLSVGSLAALTVRANTGWSSSLAYDPTSGAAVLYILSLAARTLVPGEQLGLWLDNLSGAGGDRVSQVALSYQDLAYASAAATALQGTRTTVVSLGSAGAGRAPLALSFATGAAVVADGSTANTLSLRLANASLNEGVPLVGAASSSPTHLRVRFDVGAVINGALSPTWALLTADQIAAMSASCPGFVATLEPDGWLLVPEADGILGAGESLIITLAGLVSGGSPGQTWLYLDHSGMPGFGDGRLMAVINKVGASANGGDLTVNTITASRIQLGPWTVAPSGQDLVFTHSSGNTVTFGSDGSVTDGAAQLVKYDNQLQIFAATVTYENDGKTKTQSNRWLSNSSGGLGAYWQSTGLSVALKKPTT